MGNYCHVSTCRCGNDDGRGEIQALPERLGRPLWALSALLTKRPLHASRKTNESHRKAGAGYKPNPAQEKPLEPGQTMSADNQSASTAMRATSSIG